jgi:hypothetical protein
MKFKKLYMALAGCFISTASYAGCDANGCTSKISNLYVTGNGDIYLKPSDTANGKVTCTLAENTYFTLERSHVSFSELYAMALAAKISDRSIRMRIKNNSTNCGIAYFMMYH